MYQKAFRKSAGFKMEIPRKGWSSNRSLSPVMIHEALQNTASSRNLLSFGSRQSVMLSEGGKNRAFSCILLIARDFSVLLRKYRSNFFRNRTSVNSWKVDKDTASFPNSVAWFSALLLVEEGSKEALISELVSNTKKSPFFIQNILEDFLGKTSFFHLFSQFIKESEKFLTVRATRRFGRDTLRHGSGGFLSCPRRVLIVQGFFNFYHSS